MKWQPVDEFRRTPDEDAALRKGFAAEVKADAEARLLTFTISTPSVDRVGDTIAPDGWDVTSFLKNPVMLWAHDYESLPVGKAVNVWATPVALHATAQFTPYGMIRFNDIVFDLYKGGFLSAVSVGFRPTKWAFAEDKDRPYGIDFQKQELLEFSAVPVPANPEALIEARSAGIDVAELRTWALAALKACPAPATVREFEEFLRDAGFSRRESEKICAKGFRPQGEPAAVAAPIAIPEDPAVIAASAIRAVFGGWLPTPTQEVPQHGKGLRD